MPKIKLVAPDGATSASFDGKEYPVEKDGTVTVPTEAALVLYGYGFTNAPVADQPAGDVDDASAPTAKKPKKAAAADDVVSSGQPAGEAA